MLILFGLTSLMIFLIAIYLQVVSMGKIDLSFLLSSALSSIIIAAIIFLIVITQLSLLKILFDFFYSV